MTSRMRSAASPARIASSSLAIPLPNNPEITAYQQRTTADSGNAENTLESYNDLSVLRERRQSHSSKSRASRAAEALERVSDPKDPSFERHIGLSSRDIKNDAGIASEIL